MGREQCAIVFIEQGLNLISLFFFLDIPSGCSGWRCIKNNVTTAKPFASSPQLPIQIFTLLHLPLDSQGQLKYFLNKNHLTENSFTMMFILMLILMFSSYLPH